MIESSSAARFPFVTLRFRRQRVSQFGHTASPQPRDRVAGPPQLRRSFGTIAANTGRSHSVLTTGYSPSVFIPAGVRRPRFRRVIRRGIAVVRRRIANGHLDLAPATELVAIGQCPTGCSILVDVSVPAIGAMLVGGQRTTAIPEFADHFAMALAAPHGVSGGLLCGGA